MVFPGIINSLITSKHAIDTKHITKAALSYSTVRQWLDIYCTYDHRIQIHQLLQFFLPFKVIWRVTHTENINFSENPYQSTTKVRLSLSILSIRGKVKHWRSEVKKFRTSQIKFHWWRDNGTFQAIRFPEQRDQLHIKPVTEKSDRRQAHVAGSVYIINKIYGTMLN